MYKTVQRYLCEKCFCAYSYVEDAVRCFHQQVPPRLLHDGARVVFDLEDNGSVTTSSGIVLLAFLNTSHQWQYVVVVGNDEVIVTSFSSAHTAYFMNYVARRETMRPAGFYRNFVERLKAT